MKKITDSDYTEAKELYLSGVSAAKLAKKYDTWIQSITDRLKEDGIEVINEWNLPKFREDIFSTIDTEEKAYWLGFLFADGSVSSRDNMVELSLSIKDKEHLRKFSQFVEDSGIKEAGHRCRWSRSSKLFKTDLVRYGCVPRKSLILEAPKNIPEDLAIHFVRGYVDGDGCVFYDKSNYFGRHRLEVLGTKNILDYIQTILGKSKANYRKNSKENDITLVLNYNGRQCREPLDKLYKNASVYLERKYDKYVKLCRSFEKSDDENRAKTVKSS